MKTNYLTPIKLSNYIAETENYLLFNSINQSLVEVNEGEFKEVCNYIDNPNNDVKTHLINELEEIGLFSEEQEKEQQNCRIVITPTLSCNKNCDYCYHGGSQNYSIDNKNIPMLIDYAINFIKEKRPNKISIIWHGGEPLLNIDQIVEVSNSIGNFARKNNIIIEESLLTNGILLIENLQKIQKTSINEIQISIDCNTSKKQFDEIKEFLSKFLGDNNQAFIKYNLNNNDRKKVFEIIEEFKDLSKSKNLYFRLGYLEPHGINNETEKYLSYPDFIKFYWDLAVILREYNLGWNPELPEKIYSACVANDSNSLTIGSDLKTYRCNVTISKPEWQIFDILSNKDLGNSSASDLYFNYNALEDPKCGICSFVHNCLGGCHVKRIHNQQDNEFCIGTKLRLENQIVDYYLNEISVQEAKAHNNVYSK
jgi:uncharacterized protein